MNEAIRPVFDDREKAAAIAGGRLLGRGLAAAPGAAVGRVVFDADRAVEWAKDGQQVILVRPETSPEDVAGMYAAEGIVTSRGGRTSHAAIVAVGMGKACVVGAADLSIDEARRRSRSEAAPSARVTSSRWTAGPARSSWAPSRRLPVSWARR